ncbi:hypothetical protein FACS1894111_12360 [Clostridia bacterium]|nr:hypothetical protein FACS1894111_12360 [Clostridia bacterium]
MAKLSRSKKDFILYKIKQDNFSGQTLIYGVKLDQAVLYISSPLEALDATTEILRTQLIYITAIALLLGFVIAFFMSKKLANPITKITHTAAKLAKGDYSVEFEQGHYSEIDELSHTLNYTAGELKKVEALRRELIANISHDLRTPLTMIKGYTEMIEEVSANDPEKRTQHLSIIKEETTRLENLVGEILQLSLLQSGNETIQPENLNLSETTKAVLSRFTLLLEHEGYVVESRIEHDLYVFADKLKIEQVLYNLIGNAIKHSGEKKELAIRLLDQNSVVRFEVRDSGLGIAPEDLPFIWDRYYKSKEKSRSKISSGIGLSIVKNILLLHGAAFGVENAVLGGSLFWFELKK